MHVDRWIDKAGDNVREHGLERPGQLTLLMGEELGELALGVINVCEEPEGALTPTQNEAFELISDLAILGERIQRFCEESIDDSDSIEVAGIPNKTRHLRDELDDLGALCVQMDRSLDEYEG